MDHPQQGYKLWTVVFLFANTVIVAPIFYLIIPRYWALNRGSPFPAGGHTDIMFYILLIVAVFMPFYIPLWERSVFAAVRRGKLKQKSPAHWATTLLICRSAIIGAVFVYGLIVRFAGGSLLQQLAFYPIGIVGAIIYWPTRAKFARTLERLEAP